MNRIKQFLAAAGCAAALLAGTATGLAATIPVPAGEITVDTTWTSNNEYVLQGYVYVIDGVTLTIEAGTVVRGVAGAAPNFGALYICRGAKINAVGTSDRPIIFTSEFDDLSDPFDIPFSAAGQKLWGGIVLLGKGIINTHDTSATGGLAPGVPDPDIPGIHYWQIYEGLTDTLNSDGKARHRFGGTDNDDSSGILTYVSIRHGGQNLSLDKEINGLSLGAVGRGTILCCVEVYMNSDDGFEWWGGAVNSHHLVSVFNGDEMFDMDEGHIGLHQFWFGAQNSGDDIVSNFLASDEGMELNGQPSGTGVSQTPGLQPFGKHQIYNITLLGNKADSGNVVMNTRAEYYGTIRNSVFQDFSGVDQDSSVPTYNGTVDFNHFYNNSANGIAVAANNIRTSDAINPMIANTDSSQSQNLDPRPLAGSPLLNPATTFPTPVNGFFCDAPYKGAFTATENWIVGWTALSQNQHTVVRGGTIVNVPAGEITVDTTWTAGNTYVLQGYVYVIDGVTLTIEPGTIVRGVAGAAPNFGALYVCRGGKLNALGTACAPIVFTSEFDDLSDPFDIPFSAAGQKLWGGIVLLGKGIINTHDTSATGGLAPGVPDPDIPGTHYWQIYEGLTDTLNSDGKARHRFGGTDNEDSSGVLRYVSIRHGGQNLSLDKEINGLSLGAVGRGTVLEHIEVYMNSDDGFEWWGGASNSKCLVSVFNGDEMFDMDEGHIGLHQFWFGAQNSGDDIVSNFLASDEGMELNGQPSGTGVSQTPGLQPFGKHQIYNITLLGNKADSGNVVMNTRAEYYGTIRNSVFQDFSGVDQDSSVPTYNGTVDFNHFYNNSANGIAVAANNIRTSDAINPLLSNTDSSQSKLLDPRPTLASPLFNGWIMPPFNGVFDAAAYKGAFTDDELWISGWTALANNCHLVEDAFCSKCPFPVVNPTVTVVGDSVTLSWPALPGLSYQVQESSNPSIFAATTWSNLGGLQRNAGEDVVTQTQADTIAGAGTKKYYRVICSR